MTKKTMIEYINNHADWYSRMTLGLGHHSWWYTNRSADDCINVKVYAGILADDLIEKLTDKEKKIIQHFNIDVEDWLYQLVWSDYGWIYQAREDLECLLKDKYNVESLEYGGRSGGWLAVVFDWDDLDYSEIKADYLLIKNAIQEYGDVEQEVLKAKKQLEQFLGDVNNYIDEFREYIYNYLDNEIDKGIGNIKLLKELNNE
jgi:hypothetical protein